MIPMLPGLVLLLTLPLLTLSPSPAAVAGAARPEHGPRAEGGPDPAARIHALSRAPVIDGVLDDWSGVPSFEVPAWDPGPGVDPPARAQLGWDAEHLYLALEVPDDTLVFPQRSWRYGDGFYLTVLMPPEMSAGGDGSAGAVGPPPSVPSEAERVTAGVVASASHMSFGFSRVGDRLERVVVNRSGVYFPRVDLSGVRFAMAPGPGELPVSESPDGSGGLALPPEGRVVYEVAVPWSLLRPAHPLTADSLALNIVTVDRDGGGERRFGMLAPDPGFDTERTPVRRGRLLPVGRAKPGSDGWAVIAARPVAALGDGVPVMVAAGPGPAVELSLVQDGRVVAARTVAGAGSGAEGGALAVPEIHEPGAVQRHRLRLVPDRGARTGPAVLRARRAGTDDVVERPVFLVNADELTELGSRLAAIESDPDRPARVREAVPSAAIRLQWLEEFLASAPSNAPLEEARAWWSELERDATALKADGTGLPATGGRHRLAHRSRLDGTLQPYTVVLPDGFDPERPGGYPALVALHGSGVDEQGTARTMAAVVEGRDWIVVAPRGRGLSDWYVGSAETDVLEALASAARLFPIDTARVVAAGFSMGGYGAWRLALHHGGRFRGVAILSGGACPPPETGGPCVEELLERVLDRRGRPAEVVPPLLVVHGALDRAVPVEDVRPLIEPAGAVTEVDYREVPDAAHGRFDWWDQAVDWLAARLGR